MTASWSACTDTDEAYRRSSGRRRYNFTRRLHQHLRRNRVAMELGGVERPLPWGFQRELAAALGVSEATVSRDVAAVLSGRHTVSVPKYPRNW